MQLNKSGSLIMPKLLWYSENYLYREFNYLLLKFIFMFQMNRFLFIFKKCREFESSMGNSAYALWSILLTFSIFIIYQFIYLFSRDMGSTK